MKKQNTKIKNIILYAIIFILIGYIIISNKGIILGNNRIILKSMDESTEVANLNNTINTLQASHTEYSNYIETSKTNLANAITNEGIATSSTDNFETMITNIKKIVNERTKIDESVAATADNISEGKQAYVNGKLIIGNGSDNDHYLEQGSPLLFEFYPYGKTGIGGECNGNLSMFLAKGTQIYDLENLTVESEYYIDGIITKDTYVTFIVPTQTGQTTGTYIIGVKGKCKIVSPDLNSFKGTNITMTYGCKLGLECNLDAEFSFCFAKGSSFWNKDNININGGIYLENDTLTRTDYIKCSAVTYKYPNTGMKYIEKTASFTIQ